MANEGIMGARMPMQQKPKQGYVSSLDAYDAASSAIQETNPEVFNQYRSAIRDQLGQLNLKSSEVEAFISLLEYMLQYPDQYKEIIRAGIEEGAIEEGDFPAQFDQSFITTMLAALNEQRIQQVQNVSPEAMGPGPQEPMAMKSGGLADAAKLLQSKGRNGDTILAHINPEEARMLKEAGGLGTINPYTGLREYGLLKKLWSGVKNVVKGVGNAIKEVAKSPIGKLALTIGATMALGPLAAGFGIGTAGTAAIVSGGMTALTGGSMKDVLKSAAFGYLGASFAPTVSGYLPGASGSVLNQGLTAAAMGTGFGLASGMSLKDAIKTGAITGVTGAGITYGQQQGYLPGGQAGRTQAEAPTDAAADGSNLSLAPIEGTGGVGTATENLTPVMRQDALTGQQFSVGMDGKEYLVYKDATGNNQYVRADAVNPSQPMTPNVAQASPVALSGNPAGAPLSAEGLGQQTASTYYTGGGQSPSALSMQDASLGQQTASTYYTGGGQSPDAISMRDASLGTEIGGSRYGGPAPVEDRSSYSLGARGEQVLGPVKDLYNEYLATDRPSIQAGNEQAALAGDKAVAAYKARMIAAGSKPGDPGYAAGAEAAYDAAYEANAPGLFSKYAPLAAAGLGATYLAGGFEKPPVDDTPVYDPAYTGTEYMRDNPQAFSGSLYNYQSQGAGAYDPSRATTYEGGQGGAAPGVVTPTGIMQAQYSPEYGRRRTQSLQQYYSPFFGTAEPIMAAKGGVVTAMKRVAPAITQAVAQQQAQQQLAQQAQQRAQQQAQELAQQRAQQLAQPAYNPYRETMYAGGQGVASPGVITPTGILQAQYSPNYGRRRMRPIRAADGGSITEFPRKTGPINGPGTGTSDDIPAMLSDGEFVFTAKAVRNAGGGSRRKGAARMYKLMKSLEKGGMVKG